MGKITGLVITLNEEKNICECIESLRQICDEIVVVDSCSQDRTVELAAAMGAKTLVQPYLGDGPQKNVGIDLASNTWVFSLDADERVTPELAEAIRQIDLDATPYEAFAVRRRNYIGSRWIRCCHWYPNYLVRLYRTDKTRYTDSKQHAEVPSSNSGRIKADILHYAYNNIGEMFTKQAHSFSSRSAKIIYQKGKKVHGITPFLHGFASFFLNYFVRGGIFGGIDGLSISLAMSMNAYLKYARVLEYQRDKKVLEEEDFNKVW
ncbi:MAG: glycosyltransferase family 2 protein [Bacteroidales bacterium]|nr:glycosyltransferase family 2 protein [Bacteroidales bacterium]